MEKYFDINEQKLSIRCKVYCRDIHNIKRVVIFGHGFGGHKDNHACARFAEQTTSKYKTTAVMVFDWPCHGSDARNKLSLVDCDTYLTLVLDYVKKTWETDDIYYYGTSFGGYLVLKYLSEHGNPFKKIALRCPAVSIYDSIVNTIMSDDDKIAIEKGKDVQIGFDRLVKINKNYLEELQENDIRERDYIDFADDILVIHGTEDEIIPYQDAVDFTDNNVIELITVEGADHRFRNPKQIDQAHADILKFFFA